MDEVFRNNFVQVVVTLPVPVALGLWQLRYENVFSTAIVCNPGGGIGTGVGAGVGQQPARAHATSETVIIATRNFIEEIEEEEEGSVCDGDEYPRWRGAQRA